MVGKVAIRAEPLAAHLGDVKLLGQVPLEAVREYLGSLDVFFFPSTCEGSAGAVAEAMAAGLPVVTSPNAGSSVQHGIEGFIHPYDDVSACAHAIEELLENEARRLQFGAAARARAERLTVDAYGQELVQFLRDLLG